MNRFSMLSLIAALIAAVPADASGTTPGETQASDVVEGTLGFASGVSVNGLSGPELWVTSHHRRKHGGWDCEGEGSVCFVVVLTKGVKLPAGWSRTGEVQLKSGEYVINGRVSGDKIFASEITYAGR